MPAQDMPRGMNRQKRWPRPKVNALPQPVGRLASMVAQDARVLRKDRGMVVKDAPSVRVMATVNRAPKVVIAVAPAPVRVVAAEVALVPPDRQTSSGSIH